MREGRFVLVDWELRLKLFYCHEPVGEFNWLYRSILQAGSESVPMER